MSRMFRRAAADPVSVLFVGFSTGRWKGHPDHQHANGPQRLCLQAVPSAGLEPVVAIICTNIDALWPPNYSLVWCSFKYL